MLRLLALCSPAVLLILCSVAIAWIGIQPSINNSSSQGGTQWGSNGFVAIAEEGGGSCTSGCSSVATYSEGAVSVSNEIGSGANYYYQGMIFQDTESRCLCRIDLRMRYNTGDPSSKIFTIRVWTLTGTTLNSEIGTSDTVTGVYDYGLYSFTFTTHVLLEANTSYAITVDMGGTDAAANARCYGTGSSVWAIGQWSEWASDKSQHATNANQDLVANIYFE